MSAVYIACYKHFFLQIYVLSQNFNLLVCENMYTGKVWDYILYKMTQWQINNFKNKKLIQ